MNRKRGSKVKVSTDKMAAVEHFHLKAGEGRVKSEKMGDCKENLIKFVGHLDISGAVQGQFTLHYYDLLPS